MPTINWTCPRCRNTFAIPTTEGTIVCPKCGDANSLSGSGKSLLILTCLVIGLIAAAVGVWQLIKPNG